MGKKKSKQCPRCGNLTMHEIKEVNCLSRYKHGGKKLYICKPCGTDEFVSGDWPVWFIDSKKDPTK